MSLCVWDDDEHLCRYKAHPCDKNLQILRCMCVEDAATTKAPPIDNNLRILRRRRLDEDAASSATWPGVLDDRWWQGCKINQAILVLPIVPALEGSPPDIGWHFTFTQRILPLLELLEPGQPALILLQTQMLR